MGRWGQSRELDLGEVDARPESGSGSDEERRGSRALSVFSRVLNARILRAHRDTPLSSGGIERRLGWAPKASLRLATANMREIGALAVDDRGSDSQGTVTHLTEAGSGLLDLADVLERWLGQSPFGPMPLHDTPARGMVRALVAGWDSTIVRSLAERPQTLSELSASIPEHSYPTLKRRLAKLRSANLVSPVGEGGRTTALEATLWLRHAIGPISAAARWEQEYLAEPGPIARHEVEAAFLLVVPLLRLSGSASGVCALAGPTPGEQREEPGVAAVSLELDRGRVVSCVSGAKRNPTAWALGTPGAWFDAIVDGEVESLRLGGDDPALALEVVKGMHEALFPI